VPRAVTNNKVGGNGGILANRVGLINGFDNRLPVCRITPREKLFTQAGYRGAVLIATRNDAVRLTAFHIQIETIETERISFRSGPI